MKCLDHAKRTDLYSKTFLLLLQSNKLTLLSRNAALKRVMGEHNKRSSLTGSRKPMSVTTTSQTPASIASPGGHSTGATNTSPTRTVSSQQLPSQQMAATTSSSGVGYSSSSVIAKEKRELQEIRQLLWGSNSRLDVFRRWSQGFEFSDAEPSALVQKQGGPCAVIAPVQAYILKTLVMDTSGQLFKNVISKLTRDKCKSLLIQALCAILSKCKGGDRLRIVTLPLEMAVEAKETKVATNVGLSATTVATKDSQECDDAAATVAAPCDTDVCGEISPDNFHFRLKVIQFNNIKDVEKYYGQYFEILSAKYGVLLFMYTVLLTKGIENVHSELSDTSEPLIHNTYGYGSQGLINLMLTGKAVAHVWDNEQDVGGLKLMGITEQSDVGFITLMETMRYCTVGSFFKNPRHPVWVMGSETHLSVLFSNEKRLVSPETPSEIARRVFKSYDPDGNNFIPTAVLQDVLATLDLVSETEYVEIMQRRLDPEGLGIILLNAFMDEFFPLERRSTPDTFDLMHYNGIPGSNEGNKVRYSIGSAILLESDLKSVCVSNPILTCLQTKWPNIEINWHYPSMSIPSLN